MEIDVPRRVLKETAKLIKIEARDSQEELLDYMNNFHTYVPSDTPPFKSYFRRVYENLNKLGVLHGDWVDIENEYSSRYLNQTGRDFLHTIEAVFNHYNLPIAEINRLKISGCMGFRKPMRRLERLLLPSYVHLRALGYNHIELAA